MAARLERIGREAVNKNLRYLKGVLRQAVDDGVLARMPTQIKVLRTTKKLPTILSREELRYLLEAADDRIRPLLVCAMMTGLRNTELRFLYWEDVDFEAGVITIRALGGWSSLGVVARYVRSSTRLKREAVDRLSEII